MRQEIKRNSKGNCDDANKELDIFDMSWGFRWNLEVIEARVEVQEGQTRERRKTKDKRGSKRWIKTKPKAG